MQTEEAVLDTSGGDDSEEVVLQLAIPLARATRTKCKVKAASLDSSITTAVREFLERWANNEEAA